MSRETETESCLKRWNFILSGDLARTTGLADAYRFFLIHAFDEVPMAERLPITVGFSKALKERQYLRELFELTGLNADELVAGMPHAVFEFHAHVTHTLRMDHRAESWLHVLRDLYQMFNGLTIKPPAEGET